MVYVPTKLMTRIRIQKKKLILENNRDGVAIENHKKIEDKTTVYETRF